MTNKCRSPTRAHAMNGDDVRVLEVRDGDGFLPESLDHAFAEQEPGRHDLDRDAAIERELACAEDGRHAAASELAVEFEFVRERGAKPVDDGPPCRVAFVRRRPSKVRLRISGRRGRREGCAASRAGSAPGITARPQVAQTVRL